MHVGVIVFLKTDIYGKLPGMYIKRFAFKSHLKCVFGAPVFNTGKSHSYVGVYAPVSEFEVLHGAQHSF